MGKIYLFNKTDYVNFDITLVTTDKKIFEQKLNELEKNNEIINYVIEVWENNELFFSCEGTKSYKLEGIIK